jgi:hypothetical protein
MKILWIAGLSAALAMFSSCAVAPPHLPPEPPQLIVIYTEEPFLWELASEGVRITGYLGVSTSIDIPSHIQGMTVTEIGPLAFERRNLHNVTIPRTVMYIGNEAFIGNALTSVTIPPMVVSIGYGAFASNSLYSITVGGSLASIGDAVFALNPSLAYVTLPANIRVSESAFSGSSRNLSMIKIGDNVHFYQPGDSIWVAFRDFYHLTGNRPGLYIRGYDGLWRLSGIEPGMATLPVDTSAHQWPSIAPAPVAILVPTYGRPATIFPLNFIPELNGIYTVQVSANASITTAQRNLEVVGQKFYSASIVTLSRTQWLLQHVIITGVRGEDIHSVAQQLGNAGFQEIYIRRGI